MGGDCSTHLRGGGQGHSRVVADAEAIGAFRAHQRLVPGCVQQVTYMAGSAASQAFLLSFSQALCAEFAPAGVMVRTLVPAPSATDFDRQSDRPGR